MVSAIGHLITSSCQFISRTLSSSRLVQQPAAATRVAMSQLASSAKDLTKTVDKGFAFKMIHRDPAGSALLLTGSLLLAALLGIAILSRCCRGETYYRLPYRRRDQQPYTPGPTYTTVRSTPQTVNVPTPTYTMPTYTTVRSTPRSNPLPTVTRQGELLHRLPTHVPTYSPPLASTGIRSTPQPGPSTSHRTSQGEQLYSLPSHRGGTPSGPVPNNGMRRTPHQN